MAGYTKSKDFPGITGGADTTFEGSREVFVSRLCATLTKKGAAQVISTSPVSSTWCGHSVALRAQVKNTGTIALPTDTRVWFDVTGPSSWSGNHWVGFASAAGLAPNASGWYSYTWTIPTNVPDGTYTYYAQVLSCGGAISPLSAPHHFIISCGSLSTRITSLWGVTNARCGQSSTLWAKMKNTGTATLPSNTSVWFWVTGPSWSGNHWVGSASVAGLAPNAVRWYSYDWTIPQGISNGTYTYWAQVWSNHRAISAWSAAQSFKVTGCPTAQVVSLWPVSGARCGHSSILWAQVRNTGTFTLPSSSRVWFWANGPSWSGTHWIGFASAGGLASHAYHWYSYTWAIPSGATPGSYTYWAQVWVIHNAISAWKGPQAFRVSCP